MSEEEICIRIIKEGESICLT